MAQGYTRLSDVYTPETVNAPLFDAAEAQSKIITSGAVSVNAAMSADMTGNGFLFTAPAYLNIADSDIPALIPNDDPTDLGEPENIAKRSANYVRLARDKGWASMDVVTDLTGLDPIAQVVSQYGGAVAKWRETSLMNMLKGTMNATVAGNSLVKMIGVETGSASAANQFNPDALIDLMVEAGSDTFDSLDGYTLFVHPKTYAAILKADLIDGEKMSTQGVKVPTYMGAAVVSTRVAPTRAGTTSGTVFTSYLVKNGAIQMGVGRAKVPTELQREAQIGNSGGGEIFWVRDAFGFYVNGFSFKGTATSTLSDTDLATASNWERVLSPQNVGVVALQHN